MANYQGFRPYLAHARECVTSIDTSEASKLISVDNASIILDVRQSEEYFEGAIPGAIHIPRGVLEECVERIIPVKSVPIIVYCASGVRSVFAARRLEEMDYIDARTMDGGFQRWKDEGRTWVTPQYPEIPAGQTYIDQFIE